MWFGFILSLWELFSFSYFCTKKDPRSRHKLINYANLLAQLELTKLSITNYDQVFYVHVKFQVNR